MHIRSLNSIYPLGLLLMTALQPLPLIAGNTQSHESIREAARQHILNQESSYPAPPIVKAGRLDSRLRLEKCGQPLETFSPPGRSTTARTTVGVRCSGPSPWSLYVPTNISIMLPVVVAAKDLPRGTLLTKSDLAFKEQDITTQHRGYLDRLHDAMGKKLKRDLSRGAVVAPHHMDEPLAIKRGNRVTIVANNPGTFEIRMQGQALDSGSTGDRIKVKNSSSKRIIEATIISAGIVEVSL